MKALLLSLAFAGFAASGYAQTSPQVFKGANTVLVTLPDSGTVAWKNTAKVLMNSGFIIKSSEKELLTLNTELKDAGRGGVQVAMFASVTGNVVALRANMLVPAIERTPSPLEYRGMKGSAFQQGWEQVDKVATALGGSVTYTRR